MDACSLGATRLWVGQGGMSQLGKHLTRGLKVIYRTAIEGLERCDAGWMLRGKTSDTNGTISQLHSGPYDSIVLAIPAPQAAAIVDPNCRWLPIAAEQEMEPV